MLMSLNKAMFCRNYAYFACNTSYCIWCLKCVRITNLGNQTSFPEVLAFHPFTLMEYVTFSCFVLLKFRLEFCNAKDCNIFCITTESSQTTWKVLQIKKTLFYMNASTIKYLMWMNQLNAIIISLVIASLFQVFSFRSLTCNKRYAAFT